MKFRVVGDIVAYKNPKASFSGKIHMYSPKEMKIYQTAISLIARNYMQINNLAPISGAVKLSIWAYFKIPKSFKGSKLKHILGGTFKHTVKPDRTNILKCIEDAVKDICFGDDCVVTEGQIKKSYCKQIDQKTYFDIEICAAPIITENYDEYDETEYLINTYVIK